MAGNEKRDQQGRGFARVNDDGSVSYHTECNSDTASTFQLSNGRLLSGSRMAVTDGNDIARGIAGLRFANSGAIEDAFVSSGNNLLWRNINFPEDNTVSFCALNHTIFNIFRESDRPEDCVELALSINTAEGRILMEQMLGMNNAENV